MFLSLMTLHTKSTPSNTISRHGQYLNWTLDLCFILQYNVSYLFQLWKTSLIQAQMIPWEKKRLSVSKLFVHTEKMSFPDSVVGTFPMLYFAPKTLFVEWQYSCSYSYINTGCGLIHLWHTAWSFLQVPRKEQSLLSLAVCSQWLCLFLCGACCYRMKYLRWIYVNI